MRTTSHKQQKIKKKKKCSLSLNFKNRYRKRAKENLIGKMKKMPKKYSEPTF